MKEKQTSKISTEMNTHQEIISSLKQVKWDYDETSKTGLGYRRGGGGGIQPLLHTHHKLSHPRRQKVTAEYS